MCSCDKNKSSCCGGQCHSKQYSCSDSKYGCGCGCGCSNCNCSESCCDQEDDCHKKSHKLLEIADVAWVELLKEKIKEQIKTLDPKIDELAKVVAEANHKRWKHKMQKEKCCEEHDQCCEEFDQKLCNIFSCCDDKCQTNKK